MNTFSRRSGRDKQHTTHNAGRAHGERNLNPNHTQLRVNTNTIHCNERKNTIAPLFGEDDSHSSDGPGNA